MLKIKELNKKFEKIRSKRKYETLIEGIREIINRKKEKKRLLKEVRICEEKKEFKKAAEKWIKLVKLEEKKKKKLNFLFRALENAVEEENEELINKIFDIARKDLVKIDFIVHINTKTNEWLEYNWYKETKKFYTILKNNINDSLLKQLFEQKLLEIRKNF